MRAFAGVGAADQVPPTLDVTTPDGSTHSCSLRPSGKNFEWFLGRIQHVLASLRPVAEGDHLRFTPTGRGTASVTLVRAAPAAAAGTPQVRGLRRQRLSRFCSAFCTLSPIEKAEATPPGRSNTPNLSLSCLAGQWAGICCRLGSCVSDACRAAAWRTPWEANSVAGPEALRHPPLHRGLVSGNDDQRADEHSR